ncbi:hypothetical protein D3C87_1743760 [compost metagenome]
MLIRNIRSSRATLISSMRAGVSITPALLTSALRVPSLSAAAKIASTSASTPTSPFTATAWRPRALMASTTSAAACALAW